mgnify:CR=1 FL=1
MKKPDQTPLKKPILILRTLLLALVFAGVGLVQSLNAQTYALTNTWSIAAAPDIFINPTNHLTRGMTYNPVTGHLLVASRSPLPGQTNAIYILDSATGATLGTLPYDSVMITNGTFPINMVSVTADGVIYVCNLTTAATNPIVPFKLYRWANESAMPTVAYVGDPSLGDTNGASPHRFGDSMAIRGTGAGTQILLGTLNQKMALLTTTDGLTFTAQKITTDGDASDTRWGLAWGDGDTFWAKQPSKNLKRYSLNIGAGTATVNLNVPIYTLPGGTVLTPGGPLAVDLTKNLLAIIDTTNHKLMLYDISNPANPIQTDVSKAMPAANANGNFVGAMYMKDGLLFALETNNGIQAYTLHGGIIFPPQFVAHPANTPSLWEGARWVLTGNAYGTQPLYYQWQFEGVDIPGATANSLVLPSVSTNDVGSYRLVATNSSGSATSNPALVSNPVRGNRTAQYDNIWTIEALTRPYVPTNYTVYGLAINPVNTNVIVLTRQIPTNMIVVLDGTTGAEKHYIDYSPLLPISSGWNKVDVADDGTVYLCNLSANTVSNPFRIDGILHDGPNPTIGEVGPSLYSGDPGNGQTPADVTWGIAMAVRGNLTNAQIILGSGAYNKSSRTVAILQANEYGQFTSTAITIPDAPDKFARLGIDWGPGTNTFWGKSVGNLILCEFDLVAGTGFVKKTYPLTGNRSVASSITGIRYDRNYNLLAGIQNGSPPSPVSIPVYNVSDIEAGPMWVDQELFPTYYPDVNYQGNVDFANGYLVGMGGNNGVMAFKINAGFVPAPVIVSHPIGGAYFENVSSPTISVAADSLTPVTYQWYKEGDLLAGATQSSLTLTNIQMSQAGDYWARVSTTGGYVDSQAATLEVLPYYDTAQMTNIWSVAPLTRPYLNINYYEYGMSFNPANSNLLVAHNNKDNPTPVIIAVLDALTGADKHVLDVSAIDTNPSINRYVNKIGVADDGVVYVGNRTTTPTTVPFVVYRYADDQPATVATVAYSGDPFATLYQGTSKNVGFTMDVRGAGVNTEILLSTAGTNVLSILTTTDGLTFTPHEILVPGAATAFARLGVTFGAGNTIWTKAWGGNGGLMHLVQYDLQAGTGTILRTYTDMPYEMTTLAYNDSLKLLGGLSRDDHKNMQIYSVADLDYGPMLVDQQIFPSYYSSIEANNALDFGGNTYLFGLDSNNGIMAMQINTAYAPPVVLKATSSGTTVTISWAAVNGASYQVQKKDSLDGTWENLGSPIIATGTTASFNESILAGPRFYRVQSINP